MGLLKQYWTGILLKGYVPENSFLAHSTDKSALVDANQLNFGEIGADPKVIKNNSDWPLDVAERKDKASMVLLDTYDTENTVVHNVEKIELNYDKVESVVAQHRQSLQTQHSRDALYNWAPTKTEGDEAILETTGQQDKARKRLSFADVLDVIALFRAQGMPLEDIAVCLTYTHSRDLMLEDMKLYQSVLSSGNLFGIKVFTSSLLPRYNEEKSLVAQSDTKTGQQASLFWSKNEVIRAQGDVTPFLDQNNNLYRGDLIGFQDRFLAGKLRNKSVAIVSGK